MLRHTTGHIEHPRVQQQQRQPNNSHLTFTGRAFLNVTFTLVTVAFKNRHEIFYFWNLYLNNKLDSYFKFFWSYSWMKGLRKFCIKSVWKTKTKKIKNCTTKYNFTFSQLHIFHIKFFGWMALVGGKWIEFKTLTVTRYSLEMYEFVPYVCCVDLMR